MAEPEFEQTGVPIGRLLRSLTRAGQVRVQGGRLVLLTSYGREIDSAPVDEVSVSASWLPGHDVTLATVGRTRYALGLTAPVRERLASSLRDARERAAKMASGNRRTAMP
ncbi:hypothetical protein [Streptomyces alkaliterrae]|uniref:PH domain-containing protein n=1 Tax=Streptomyces alkaliterrae TaxID=2213162 RepID=A0A5P0YSW8_9ACTN|nr:hypothetical protein [Streptomyces alkaliterrae]MBB1254211.1 hypothetical protein [Streptomyces alkaliterrae]MBB1260329.1 hypothetical protein [Streptomyces alkaliterrae]MQS03413.1 hypothetical protein [Streptomyces alkaliterrae]